MISSSLESIRRSASECSSMSCITGSRGAAKVRFGFNVVVVLCAEVPIAEKIGTHSSWPHIYFHGSWPYTKSH